MHPEPELAQLLKQFVTVRLTNFKGVDMNFFKFDYDQTFAILMMSGDGAVYSRFGSNDAKADAGRMSVPGLKQAMRQVLALKRSGWRPVRPLGETSTQGSRTLADIPAYAKSKAADEGCAHCHFANNFRFKQLMAEGKFHKEMLYQYPFPENIGITLKVDKNNVVQAVLPESPAQKAGIRVGDTIQAANNAKVLTSADLQYALNLVPEAGTVSLQVARAGQPLPLKILNLERGWRNSDISWRPSTEVVPPTLGIWATELKDKEKQALGIATDKMALRVSFFFPAPVWAKARGDLKLNDIITGLNGQTMPKMNTRQFHTYFRTHFNVGDTVTLNVLRGQQKLALQVPCIDPGAES